jgi:hypothetical protein
LPGSRAFSHYAQRDHRINIRANLDHSRPTSGIRTCSGTDCTKASLMIRR